MSPDRPLRIAYVIDSVFAPAGGTELQLLQLVEGLDRDRYEPTIFCPYSAEPGVTKVNTVVLDTRVTKSPALLAGIRRFAGTLERGKFDVVQTHFRDSNIVGTLAASWARTPILISTRRGVPYAEKGAGLAFLRWLNRRATWFVANSQATRDRYARLEGLDRERVDVIYNGLHPSRLAELDAGQKRAVREGIQVPPDVPLIGIVANVRPVKGLEDFCTAAADVGRDYPDAHFVIVGRGDPDRVGLGQLEARFGMGSRLRFLGPRADVPELLQAFDIGVLASHSESFSNSWMEYVAAGLPVVVTDVGGVREIIEDGKHGFIVPPRAPEKMAEGLKILLAHPGGPRAWREEWHLDDRFRPESMIAGHEQLYERLAGQFLNQAV